MTDYPDDLVIRAEAALRANEPYYAKDLFRQAATVYLTHAEQATRSFDRASYGLFAASNFLRADERAAAERAALKALLVEDVPTGIRDSLREIVRKVWPEPDDNSDEACFRGFYEAVEEALGPRRARADEPLLDVVRRCLSVSFPERAALAAKKVVELRGRVGRRDVYDAITELSRALVSSVDPLWVRAYEAAKHADHIGCTCVTQLGELPSRSEVAEKVADFAKKGDFARAAAHALFGTTLPEEPPEAEHEAVSPEEAKATRLRLAAAILRAEGYLVAEPTRGDGTPFDGSGPRAP